MAGGPAVPVTTYRGPTAKTLLDIDWQYPVYTPPENKDGEATSAKAIRRALSREEALRYIAGDDPRPLLVLRECKVCNGTDDALLKGGTENEKTYLLSTWFHCVKLPVDVMEEDHPFHNLFLQDETEHLFVCSVDGSNHDPLESQTSRVELWDSMRALLAQEYKSKPDKALKAIAKLLDQMDRVDGTWNRLQRERDQILEEDGPDSRKLPKLEKEIAKVDNERKALIKKVEKASKLELKKRKDQAERDAAFEKAKSGG